MRWRALAILAVAFGIIATLTPGALALTPRVAICGRVTAYDTVIPGGPFVTLGTQHPRSLALGSVVPQVGQEICIWGIDVGNGAPPGPEQRVGIVDYRIAPVASIGCADSVSATAAGFQMPGETSTPLPNPAILVLPLNKPAGNGCVRIAVDAVGNPVAVVLPRSVSASPAASSTPRPSVATLPSTDTTDGSIVIAILALVMGAIVALALVIWSRRGIPS